MAEGGQKRGYRERSKRKRKEILATMESVR